MANSQTSIAKTITMGNSSAWCYKHDRAMESVGYGEFSTTFCPKCSDEKEAEHEKAMAEQRATDRRNAIEQGLNNTMIAPRFRSRTLENYEAVLPGQKEALASARWFLANMDTCAGMFLIGGTGTGKNHIAAGIVNEYMKQPSRTALFTEAVKVVRSIKETWNNRGASESEALRLYNQPDLLVIDEVGVQFESNTERMYLTEIVNDRYNWLKPTIISGNVTLKEITTILGDRVVDRFREGGKVVVFDWQSYRSRKSGVAA